MRTCVATATALLLFCTAVLAQSDEMSDLRRTSKEYWKLQGVFLKASKDDMWVVDKYGAHAVMCKAIRRMEAIIRRRKRLLKYVPLERPTDVEVLMKTPMEFWDRKQAEITIFAQQASVFAYRSLFRDSLDGCPGGMRAPILPEWAKR